MLHLLSDSKIQEYTEMWQTMEILPGKVFECQNLANIAFQKLPRYLAITQKINIPPKVLAMLHMRESGWNFGKHLHNGDPLTAKTVHLPAGRPDVGLPPFTFDESAVDAITFFAKNWNIDLDQMKWDIPETLCFLEAWNGFAYRKQKETCAPYGTPYLWSFTNKYFTGYFLADGKYDASTVCQEAGCAPILRALAYGVSTEGTGVATI